MNITPYVLAAFSSFAFVMNANSQENQQIPTPVDMSAQYSIMGDDPREHVIYFFGDLFEVQIEKIVKEISGIIKKRNSNDQGVVKSYLGEPRIFFVLANDGGSNYENVSLLSDFMKINPAEFVLVTTGRVDFTVSELIEGADATIALPYSSIIFRYASSGSFSVNYAGFTASDFERKRQELERGLNGVLKIVDTLKRKIVSMSKITEDQFDNMMLEQRPISALRALELELVDYVMTPKIDANAEVIYVFDK